VDGTSTGVPPANASTNLVAPLLVEGLRPPTGAACGPYSLSSGGTGAVVLRPKQVRNRRTKHPALYVSHSLKLRVAPATGLSRKRVFDIRLSRSPIFHQTQPLSHTCSGLLTDLARPIVYMIWPYDFRRSIAGCRRRANQLC